MKKFKFSLEALLRIKIINEDSVKEELAKKNVEIINEENLFRGLKNQLSELQNTSHLERRNETDITKLRYSVNFRNRLKLDMLTKSGIIENLQKEVWAITQRLIKATQEKKAIEILREKKYSEWKKEYRITEQNITDDISSQGHIRKNREVKYEVL